MNLRSQDQLQKFSIESKGNVAFLRFQRAGLKQGKYSDWDIVVRDRERALKKCASLFGKPLLRIPRQYVIQHFYDWGQCDILPVLEWNGIEYIDAEIFWGDVMVGEDGIPRPALGHDAYIAWMTGLLWGRRFNQRYQDFIARAAVEDEVRFRECLDTAFGQSLGRDLYRIAVRGDAGVATHWVTQMRLRLTLLRLKKAPLKTIRRIWTHWHSEWKFHRRLALPWIALLGPDGTGKSTLIANLRERLKLSRLKIRTIHWLPKFSLESRSPTPSHIETNPHGKPAKSSFLSVIQLVKIATLWWVASLRYLFHLRAKSESVFSDRFYSDLLVDPKRYRYGASLKLARGVFRFLPKPDRVIVLLASPDEILSRKKEVSEAELDRQLAGYKELASEWGARAEVIDSGNSPNEVTDEAFRIFCEALKERTR